MIALSILEKLELYRAKLIDEGPPIKCKCRFNHYFDIDPVLDNWCPNCDDENMKETLITEVNKEQRELGTPFQSYNINKYGIMELVCENEHIYTFDIDEIPAYCEKCNNQLEQTSGHQAAHDSGLWHNFARDKGDDSDVYSLGEDYGFAEESGDEAEEFFERFNNFQNGEDDMEVEDPMEMEDADFEDAINKLNSFNINDDIYAEHGEMDDDDCDTPGYTNRLAVYSTASCNSTALFTVSKNKSDQFDNTDCKKLSDEEFVELLKPTEAPIRKNNLAINIKPPIRANINQQLKYVDDKKQIFTINNLQGEFYTSISCEPKDAEQLLQLVVVAHNRHFNVNTTLADLYLTLRGNKIE